MGWVRIQGDEIRNLYSRDKTVSPLGPVPSRDSLMISYLTIVQMGYVELLLLIPSIKIDIILYDIKITTGRCVLLIETFVNFRTNDMLQSWGLAL